MDDRRFDRLAMALSAASTRRGALRLIPALLLAGWLSTLLGDEEAAADGRRRRRKKRHKHGRPRPRGGRKQKSDRKKCKPEPAAQTCAGRCGPVENRCGKSVDCGSCDCDPPCPICQTCDAASVECVPDDAGQTCADGRQCCGGECCLPTQRCTAEDACCTPLPQAEACARSGRECGPASDGCEGSYDCGACPNGLCQACDAAGQCVAANDGFACSDGNLCNLNDTCQNGVCTPERPVVCDAPPSVCQSSPGTCNPSSGACDYPSVANGTPCGGGNVCCGGRCLECCDDSQCPATAPRCCGGACTACLPALAPCGDVRPPPSPPCECACCSGSWQGAARQGLCV